MYTDNRKTENRKGHLVGNLVTNLTRTEYTQYTWSFLINTSR